MFDSYNKNKIENTYKRLKRVGIAPTWVRHSRTSVAQMIRNYDGEVAIHGNKAVREIKRRLEKAKSHIVPKTSSMEVYNALMSGKYDSKLTLVEDTEYCNNHIEAEIVNGKLYTLSVRTSDEFDRRAPTEYTKKLEWIYENFEFIFVKLPDIY